MSVTLHAPGALSLFVESTLGPLLMSLFGLLLIPFSLSAGRKQFARHEWAQKAAYLLGCTLEELSSSIFKHQAKGTLQRSSSFRQGPEEASLPDGSGTHMALWGLNGLP